MPVSAAIERTRVSERAGNAAPAAPLLADLSSGDPDYATPAHISAALTAAVEAGYTHYPPSGGDPELRAALAERIRRRTGVEWAPEDVVVTNGGAGAIFAAMTATLNPGDQVLLPQPIYSLYADVARLIGAEVTFVPLDSDFHLDLDALAAALTPRARMLVINSPGNPTGASLGAAELEAVARLAAEHDLLVLSDEAYDDLLYDDRPHLSPLQVDGLAERTLYVNTFSKTYAMTGWRIGYLAAGGGVAGAARVAHTTAVGAVNAAVQRAALAALTGPTEWLGPMLNEYAARRDVVDGWVRTVPGLSWRRPEGAFYGFLRYDAPLRASQVAARLREFGVGARSGTEFGPGGEGHVRISYAVDRRTLGRGLELIGHALAEMEPAERVAFLFR
jgi:aspartate/methionine/tyrosine aminotransferase